MNDFVAALGIGLSLAFSMGALLYAVWYGRHSSMELARPDARQMELREQQRAAINDLLYKQQELTGRVLELELEMTDLRVTLSDYQQGTAQLITQLETMKVTPAWQPKRKLVTHGGSPESESVALYKAIAQQFSLEEMDELKMAANIPDGEVGGDTVTAQALELVQYAQRHGQLDALIAACKKARPRGKWGKA